MIRLPAVAGQFYPANPRELSALIHKFTAKPKGQASIHVRACLVPHAGYVYSGHVAGAVFSRIALPKKILLLGVRHQPRGEPLAILSEGAWRTPLGDATIHTEFARQLRDECPLVREDAVAHNREHSLEVELPFLQQLDPAFSFVPIAVGTLHFDQLSQLGTCVGRVLTKPGNEDVLVVTSTDMNHYEDDETTRWKDHMAIEALLQLDAKKLYQVCREENISMCGLGPAVVMLTAMKMMGVKNAQVVRYATSGDVSEDRTAVVGYAGMIFN